ncbi:MAG TPA: S-layer homology domain-containing protein [Symbiobacteriaceae bacterium]|nr:S-layer homology domain-containing protein [Symbiobacteriaceae bacterium]
MTTRKLAASVVAAALLASVASTAMAAPSVPGAVYSDTQAAGANKPVAQVAQELTQAGVKDVAPDYWAAGSITVLVSAGLLTPDANGQIQPEAEMSTAAGVSVFAKVLGIAAKNDTPEVALAKAKEAGIIGAAATGETDLPRIEVARMLAKALGAQPVAIVNAADYPFADFDSISPEDRGLLAALYKLGIFKGYEDKTFRPDVVLTKAQIAILVDRILGAGK